MYAGIYVSLVSLSCESVCGCDVVCVVEACVADLCVCVCVCGAAYVVTLVLPLGGWGCSCDLGVCNADCEFQPSPPSSTPPTLSCSPVLP